MTAIQAAAAYMFLHQGEALASVIEALHRMGCNRHEVSAAYRLYVAQGGV